MISTIGLRINDVIKTSYGTGPYLITSIWGPYWWWMPFNGAFYHVTIWPYPVISIGTKGREGINHIHEDNGRWFTDMGDEIFRLHENTFKFQTNFLENLFVDVGDPRKRPYQFDPDVDYSIQSRVFKCWKCRRDFNGEYWNGGHTNPHCPFCNAWVALSIIIMEKVIPGNHYQSECVRALNS